MRTKGLTIAIVGVPILTWLIVRYGLEFNGLYGQDSFEYLRYARDLKAYWQGGPLPTVFFWSEGYPIFGALISLLGVSAEWGLQILSVIGLAGGGLILLSLIHQRWPESGLKAETYVFLFFTCCPFMLRAGWLVMSDVVAVLFVLLSWRAFSRLTVEFTLIGFLSFVFFAAFAILIRYACFFVLLLPSMWILYKTISKWKFQWLFAAGLITLLCWFPHFLLRPDPATWRPAHMEFGWSVSNFFKSSFLTTEGLRSYKLPNLIYAFYPILHPGYWMVGALVFLGVRRNDLSGVFSRVLLGSVVFYLIFLTGMAYQNKRFFMILFPLILLLLYPAFSRIWDNWYRNWMTVLPFLGMLLVQVFITAFVFRPLYERNQLELKAAELIRARPEPVLYTFDMHQAMQGYMVKPAVKDLWLQFYDQFEVGALILFNEPAFTSQWSGYNPMMNWHHLHEFYELEKIEEIGAGWALFKITADRTQ